MNTYGSTSALAAEEIESVADTITLEETSDGSLSDSRDNVCVEEDETLKPDTWEATGAMSNMDLSEEVAVDNTVLTSQNYSEMLARVNSEMWPNDLRSVIAQPGQYGGSLKKLPKNPSQEALDVAFEALEYWNLSKNGFTPEEDWTLPDEFMSFFGDGKHNYFYYYDDDGAVVFCDCVPNAPLPENIDKLYRRYVLGPTANDA